MTDQDAPTIGKVIAAQIASYRRRKGWSQERLATEISSLGHSTSRLTVRKTEIGDRRVPVDELYVYAMALDVPMVMLMVPLGVLHDMTIPGGIRLTAETVRRQIVGEVPYTAPDGTKRNLSTWLNNSMALRLFERCVELGDRVAAAEATGDEAAYEVAGEAMCEHLLLMGDCGLMALPDRDRG